MPFTTTMNTVTTVDNSLIELMDKQFVVASHESMVMDQFVTYRQMIGAKSIEFPKYSTLATIESALGESDDAASVALTDAQVILTPAEYGNVVTNTKLASLQSGGIADLAASRLVGINAAQSMNRLCVLAAEASTNKLTVDGGAEAALTAGDIMTPTFLNQLYNKLKRASVMPFSEGLYVAVLHPDQISDLVNASAAGSWQDVMKYSSPENVLKNEIGMMAGFRIISNALCSPHADAGDAAVDTYYGLFMGYNALGKAESSPLKQIISGPYDKLNRFLNVGWHFCGQYKIVDQDAIYTGITASAYGANT